MKIGGVSGMAGSGVLESMIDAERAPIRSSEQRRERTTNVRDQFKSFDGMLTGLGKSLDGLKTSSAFSKLAIESSHPDLLDGTVAVGAKPGIYELEIDHLAKAERQLAYGFSDADKTAVGFGYMRVGAGNLIKDVTIEPGSTLNDVAQRINESEAGVRAMVINTGMKENPFRLLVSSEKTGEDTVLELDPDTTFAEFKQIASPRDLNVKFEGVDVRRETNKLDNLIEGVNLQAKRAEPGTKVQVEIKPDIPKTSDGIKDFVKQYNEVVGFAKKQSQIDPNSGKPGLLSGDSAIKGAVRKLQGDVSSKSLGGLSLAEVGITTNPHSGELQVNEEKLTEALSKNYEGVASLFATTESGPGLAQKLSESVSTRVKGMNQYIKNQNQQSERQEARASKKKEQLERTFASLDAKMAAMQGTSEFLGARFSSPAPTVQSPAKSAGAPNS
ncbi:MAG: flagellar filament capping protein FliD [Proteobacteria bacterium]|nr:flagellar filament capping protein FliD [Pseudomonadota bacterium]